MMSFDVDFDCLTTCKHCGCVYDYTIEGETNEWGNWKSVCPVCKTHKLI